MEWEHDDYWEAERPSNPNWPDGHVPTGPYSIGLWTRQDEEIAKVQADLWSMCNSLVVCVFDIYPGGGIEHSTLLGILNAATGWNMTMEVYVRVGERAINLTRALDDEKA